MTNIVPFEKPMSRLDGFKNLLTGYGTSRDHGEQFQWSSRSRLDKATLDGIYAQHPLAAKIVDLLPADGTREWVDIDHDRSDDVAFALKQLEAKQVFCEALKFARLHGGAAVYMEIDDGRDVTEPVNYAAVRGIGGLHVIEKDYIAPTSMRRSLRHERYRITVDSEEENIHQTVEVHRSRLLIFQGESVSRDWMLQNGGWCQSVIERCYKALMAYSISHGLIPNILKDFIRDVIKIDGLADLAINDCEADRKAFNDRMDSMLMAQSMLNKLVLDTSDDFQRSTTAVSGINDLIRNPERALVAASGIPHTKLLGESPGGSLGQQGTSQEKDYAKLVASYQADKIALPLEKLLMTVGAALGIRDDIPFNFRSIDKPTQKEEAEIFNLVTQSMERLVKNGIITPDEAVTMIDSEKLCMLPKIDKDSRLALAEVPTNGEEA
jgi:uncharacterized protein